MNQALLQVRQLFRLSLEALFYWMLGSLHDKPKGTENYDMKLLVEDVAAVIRHAGRERAIVIGHDWGASATHGAAVLEPGRWRKVVSMAVPPGGAIGMSFLTNLQQIKRSWYMFFFQSPLADLVVHDLVGSPTSNSKPTYQLNRNGDLMQIQDGVSTRVDSNVETFGVSNSGDVYDLTNSGILKRRVNARELFLFCVIVAS